MVATALDHPGNRALTAWREAARPAALLGLLIAAGVVARLLPGTDLLRGADPATLVLLGAALCAIGLPRQIVCYAAGAGFGIKAGIVVAMAAQLLGCVADVAVARTLARAWVARRLGARLARFDRALCLKPFTATLTLRLLPVGNNLLTNLVAGVSGLALAPFLAASALGYLPQTAIFVLAGAGVVTAQWVPVALAVALFALSAALGWSLLRARAGTPVT